uniref:Photosystem I reaction center subunit PsaK n=1 Tax=Bangiopsis subsimplex TaxID=139980 RepID=A0A1C9CCR8_9RHOD|nr:photosystem I subunit X [Bangiopsis subsimplex]AOM66190.1 photosystem I subunit X [Bangiopsis subsimplex]ARO90449.1 photosystem I reaction center subunit X [Bangiopsis subsimplex]
MTTQFLIGAVANTSSWSLQTATIMVTCNLLVMAIGRYAIQVRGLGPSIPLAGLKGFGLPELLATASLGHIIGAGVILGGSSVGLIN